MTLLALTRLTSEMKSPQKQNQNREGGMASAGGSMVPCFCLPAPQPRPRNRCSLVRSREPLSYIHTDSISVMPGKRRWALSPRPGLGNSSQSSLSVGHRRATRPQAERGSWYGEAVGRGAWSQRIREATSELSNIPGRRHQDRKEEGVFRPWRAAPRGWSREGGHNTVPFSRLTWSHFSR